MKNHVTLNGQTFFYTSDSVSLKGQVIYRGVVNMDVLNKLAQLLSK